MIWVPESLTQELGAKKFGYKEILVREDLGTGEFE